MKKLEEFRAIINQKLEIAKSDYEETMKGVDEQKHQRCKWYITHL